MVQKKAGAPTRTCLVCGKEYPICKRCEELKTHGVSSWRLSCDTPECFKAFLILNDYSYQKLGKDEAKRRLDAILTEEMLPYEPGAKKLIDEICGAREERSASETPQTPAVEPERQYRQNQQNGGFRHKKHR